MPKHPDDIWEKGRSGDIDGAWDDAWNDSGLEFQGCGKLIQDIKFGCWTVFAGAIILLLIDILT